MARIYLTGSGPNRGYHTGSGIVSLPSRVEIRDRDSRLGSYPTNSRTGDKDFSGKFSVHYDDADTLNFVTSTLNYPQLLPSHNRNISGGIVTPNIRNGLQAAGTTLAGASDVHFTFGTGSEKIEPFDESRMYVDNDNVLFQTGTAEDVLPGFGQRLSSKTILSFDCSPSAPTKVCWHTGSSPTRPQIFALRFISNTPADYVPNPSAATHHITISVTGSAVSAGKPGTATTGGAATSTYGFVFNDGSNQGNIADLTTRERVIINISGLSDSEQIAQAFATGVNNLDSTIFAEYTRAAIRVGNNTGDLLYNMTGPPPVGDYVLIRNKRPGKPLLETSDTSKIDYSTLSYANGGPFVDATLVSAVSGTLVSQGVDQTVYANSNVGLHTGRINSGIAYFDWHHKKWEIIGDLRAGINVDYANSEPFVTTGSMLAVVPASYYTVNIGGMDYQILNRAIGMPCDIAGFPLATKFNATGSQLLFMSSSVSSPFLVEQVSLQFSASMGGDSFSTSPEQAHNAAFMLILERQQPLVEATKISKFELFNTRLSPYTILENETRQKYNKDRRIIWLGRIGKFGVSSFATIDALQQSRQQVYESCELWVPVPFNGQDLPTGSFNIHTHCKTFGLTPRATPNYATREDVSMDILCGVQNGGRNLDNMSDGRSFLLGTVGSQLASTSGTISYPVHTNEGYDIFKVYDDVLKISPFVLFPQDKLILACVNQPYAYAFNNIMNEPHYHDGKEITLLPGPSKLTLFGSLLRNGQPVSPESNQPLTSDAVHEDIHYDDPVYDQFDVEPTSAFVGTYLDNIVTGSMSNTQGGGPFSVNVRRVLSTVTAGQAGTTGSLPRFVRIYAEPSRVVPRGINNDEIVNGETLYDSVPTNFTGSDRRGFLPNHSNYGLADGRNKKNSAVMRWDRYGQFRDMLEQAPSIAYVTLKNGQRSNAFAVDVNFFSRPDRDGQGVATADPGQTHSQNLSTHATSSMPYFDNDRPLRGSTLSNGVDRPDNPDVTLADTTI